jgi:hypothetical protein
MHLNGQNLKSDVKNLLEEVDGKKKALQQDLNKIVIFTDPNVQHL